MDEGSLETALQTYRAQLQQVELALGAGLDSSEQADLRQLHGDLRELIELTEASLVSVRKSKLLATLDQAHLASQQAVAEAEGEDGPAAAGAGLETPAAGEAAREPRSPEQEAELSGTKVSAPYYSPWGTLEYHNAMVVGAERAEGGPAAVRVLYLYPTHKSLKPCSFFLEGKCRFKDNCRFSHGQVVSLDELRPFQEPDLSSLQAGSACLAKHQDGLWHPARITDVDSGFYTVKFDSLLLKEVVVEGDSVLPPLRLEPVESSESEDSDAEDSSYARVVDSEAVADRTDGMGSTAFASWEVHTRGIGSRLLEKMGYEPGKGLGRNAQGRVEPIHAVVLPRGKSLDHCVEALQRTVKGDKVSTHRPPKCHGKGTVPAGRPPPRNVFDFLNEKLQSQAPKALEVGSVPLVVKGGKQAYHASKSTKRALSLQLLQTEEQISRTQRDIQGIQEALTRNAGRHGVAQLREKLAGAQQQLGQLRAQEAGLRREQRKADTHKRMTEF